MKFHRYLIKFIIDDSSMMEPWLGTEPSFTFRFTSYTSSVFAPFYPIYPLLFNSHLLYLHFYPFLLPPPRGGGSEKEKRYQKVSITIIKAARKRAA